MRAGFAPDQIQLTSQMPSHRLAEFVANGVRYNACSLHQLESYGRAAPGSEVSVRMNAGPFAIDENNESVIRPSATMVTK